MKIAKKTNSFFLKNYCFTLFFYFFSITAADSSILSKTCFFLTNNRDSSYPYISGNTFRAFADYFMDEDGINFSPEQIKKGDIIFLRMDNMKPFIEEIHPRIQAPYIIITHNSDYCSPNQYSFILDDPKILAWFGNNINLNHPKFIGIPSGIANQCWAHGNVVNFNNAIELAKKALPKKHLLIMNFSISGSPWIRRPLYTFFEHRPFCYNASKYNFDPTAAKSHYDYLLDFAQSKFMLSPLGNGLDCHKTWEALLLGCYPIVISSSLNPLFEDLPVLIVKSWNEVTEEFLEKKYIEFASKVWNFEKIYSLYWFRHILDIKKNS